MQTDFQNLEFVNAGLRIPKGVGRHPARTMSVHELIYVRAGELRMLEDRIPLSAGPGQSLLLRAGRRHEPIHDYGEHLVFYWAYFRGEVELAQHLVIAHPERMLALWHRLIEDRDLEPGAQAAANLSLARILLELSLPQRPDRVSDATAVLSTQARAFIRLNLREELSTSMIAEELGCCPDYLGRVYRRAYGKTIVEDIQERRVALARNLLIAAELPIDEVARECGYLDTGYFRRVFRKHTGLTPAAFQRRHVRIHLDAN